MNHVERFRAVMASQAVERLPRWEWAMWWDQAIVPLFFSPQLGGSPVTAGGPLASLKRELGQPPKLGQTIRHDGLELVVRRVRRGRVFEASASMRSRV